MVTSRTGAALGIVLLLGCGGQQQPQPSPTPAEIKLPLAKSISVEGPLADEAERAFRAAPLFPLPEHAAKIAAVGHSPDGRLIATVGDDSVLKLLDTSRR